MNILHITTFLTGGAGRIVYDLASMQKSLGHDVTVLTSIDEDSGCINYEEYTLGLKDKGIELSGVNSIFKRDIYKNINAANKAREIINLKKIDIIHAHAAVPGLVGVIARSGNKKYIPVIQTMHGWGTNKTQEHEKMDVTVMNGLDSIIAVSMSDKVLLEDKGVNSDRIKVIYNGINEETFIPDSEDDVFKELSAYKNMGYSIIGCIGTVCQRKNQQLLLNAFAKVSNKVKSVCVFIG